MGKINTCAFEPESFLSGLEEILAPLINDSLEDVLEYDGQITDNIRKGYLHWALKRIGETFGITRRNVEEATELAGDILYTNIEENLLPDEDDFDVIIGNDLTSNTSGTPVLEAKEELTTQGLINQEFNEEAQRRAKFNDNIFTSNYGKAMDAKIMAKRMGEDIIIKSCLVSEDGRIVLNESQLNEEVRKQQQKLLDKVLLYLRNRLKPEVIEKNPDIFGKGLMYDKNGYTGIVELIQDRFGGYLSKDSFNESELDELSRVVLSRYGNVKAKTKLDGYNAWVLLTNFDTLLERTFGKAININPEYSKYTHHDKYSMSKKGSNVYQTWRTSDEIFLSKEVNNIVQLLITHCPYLVKKGESMGDVYVKFNQFEYIISKIKDLLNNLRDSNYVFAWDQIYELGLSDMTVGIILGKSMQQLLGLEGTDPQLFWPAIFEVLDNESLYNRLIGDGGPVQPKYFDETDLNIIHSLSEGIFSESSPNSLYSINLKSGLDRTNYFSYITLVTTSVFGSKYLQYFKDNDGNIYVRNMFDQSINNIRRKIELNVSALNSRRITNYDEWQNGEYQVLMNYTSDFITPDMKLSSKKGKELNATIDNITLGNWSGTLIVKNENGALNYYLQNKETGNIIASKSDLDDFNLVTYDFLAKLIESFKGISFIIPHFSNLSVQDVDLQVDVDIKTGNVTTKYGGKKVSLSNSSWESISLFVEDVLRLNFENKPQFFNHFKNLNGEDSEIAEKLLGLASRVLMNSFVSGKILVDGRGKMLTEPNAVKKKLNSLYGTSVPVYNKNIAEINMFTDADRAVLGNLAWAQALAEGTITSSQIKDGNGNAMSSCTLSRLLGSYRHQWEIQNKLPNSATRNFHLLRNGVLKQVYAVKDFKDIYASQSKSSLDMTSQEMEEGSFLYDFVSGLIEDPKNNKTLGNGIIALLASVNADKGNIGRLVIDLNKEVSFEYKGKNTVTKIIDILMPKQTDESYSYRAINKDTSMLEEFIRQEMKDYFDLAYANINEEWRKVYEAAIQQGKLQRPGVEPTDYQGYMMQNLNTLGGMNKLNDIIKRNNLDYPNSQIVLIDQVHYVEDGNQLVKNRTFETLRNRFSNPLATADFFYEQSISTLGNLLKDDFSIVIPLDEDVEVSPEIKLLRRNLKGDWIDVNSNKLILAKIGDKNITKTADLFSLASKYNIPIKLDNGDIRNPIDIILDIIKLGNETFTFNPFLANYNEVQYLFSQEWLFSTVGSHYAHPAKAFTDELVEEASRYNAQNKRNVSMTAAMHAFQKGLLSGIPSDYNIAIIRDVKDTQYNVSGEIDGKVKPYDGATFVNPFIVYLENASLGGAAAGVVKKQFVHFYDEKTGTGGIIKTAGFGLTNDLIKNSTFYQDMMYNMTHYIWRKEDGSAANIDITQNWKKQPIQYYNSGDKNGNKYFRDPQTGKYYRIDKIEKVGVNQYQRTLTECDLRGIALTTPSLERNDKKELITHTVNSNYTLWQLFGGENSVEIMEGNTTFTPSEYSILAVVNAMNSVGTVKAGYTIDLVRSQSQLYQPLKHSDVHYMPTEGAVKQGAGNINGKECYEGHHDLNIMRIHMNQAGIQLDKEHHADNERLSLMTLVISSCAARGYTPEEAMEMYQALSSLTELGISEYIDSFKEYFKNPNKEENKDAFQKAITDTIVDALVHQDNSDSDILSIITQKLMDKAKEGKEIKFKDIKGVIPYSDPGVFRKVASTINVALTKSSIKIKIPGLLSVLCPSFGIMKLYGNKKLEAYPHKQALEEALRVLEETAENNLVSRVHDVELGRHYKIYGSNLENTLLALGSGEIKTDASGNQYIDFNLVTPTLYNALRNIIDPDPNEYSQEDALSYDPFYEGNIDSELFKNPFSEGGLNVGSQERADELFEALLRGEEEYSGINLGFYVRLRDAILQKIESGALDNIPLQYVKAESEGKARIIGNLIREKKARQHGITKIVENIVPGRDLANYNVRFTANGRRFQIWDLESVQKLFKLKGLKGYDQEEAIRLTRKVQEDLQALTKAKDQSIALEVTLTGGRKVTVEPDSIEIQPYEIVMPKIFASVFGLETYDSVDEILRDPDFFTKRIIQRYTKSIPSGFFDLELKRINGNHMYFLQRDRAIVSENFRRKEIKTVVEKGKVFRCDDDRGNIMYQLSVTAEDVEKGLKQDEVWEYISPDGKVTEVIVTGNLNDNNNISDYNNLKHYIDKNGFVSVNISSRIDDVSKYVDILQRSKNKSAKRFIRFLRSQGSDVKSTIKELNKTLSGINDSLGKGNFKLTAEELTNPAIRMIHEIGIETHTSFQQSLDIIAARIPAQSMQSFMPMRVVAFDNPDRNTAYVSTAQIWLQGSDYDIDAVSLATYAIDKSGIFVGWSPYFNLQNIELLGASKRLPFPTGKEAKNGTWGLAYSDYVGVAQDESDKPFYWTKDGIQTRLNTYKRIQKFITLLKAINEDGVPMPAERTVVLDINGQSLSVPVGDCIDAVRDAVNEHNMYLKEVGKDELENMTKNFVLSREYMISSSPVNLIESQAPIDRQTQPLKDIGNQSPKALDSVRAIPGDFTTAIHAIVENQTGKKGVGICAVGLKSFFALTQYYNYLLNHGTAEQQENLKLGPKGSGVFVAGKYYNLLANARAENPNETITNKDVLRMITSVNNDKDAALVLSALLSLATDNAKELLLAKLNAGTNMLGMYVYGISIGMDFRDISDILMSPIGFKISSMMNDNVFSDDPRMNIQDIFDYFELGPRKKLNDFEVTYLKDQHVTSPVVYLRRLILKEKGKTEKEVGRVKTYELLKEYVDEILSKGDLAYAIGEVEKLRNNFKPIKNNIELNAIFNRLMDFVETYVIEMDSKNNSLLFNSNKKAKLKKIISGAQTGADTIGLEVGLELGLETGGTAPPGFLREKYDDGYDALTLLEKFGVHEISPELLEGKRGREFFIPRTEQNVINSDGTVYFYNGKPSPGYYATRRAAEEHGKPFIGIDVTQPNMYMLKNWMIKHNIETLNVAGNRASSFGDNGNVIREALTFAMTPTSYSAYNEFKKLSDGAEELKTFGQILHVNQGLPSSALELISLIDNIEGAISSRLYARYREAKRRNPHDKNIKLEDYTFNLHEFLYGDPSQANPREYTDSIIAAYEENKAAFNLLDAVDKVPHFRSYLLVADMAHQSLMKSSAKYRAIYNLGRYAIEQIGAKTSTDKESVYKRTESFVNDYLRRTWMLDRGIQIKVPYKQQFFDELATPLDLVIGTEYYDILGAKKEVTSNLGMQILLGIRVNDATFKMLMEKKIIPDLMKGYADSNRKHKVLLLESNLFIQSLAPALNSRTPNFNTIVGYSLPINMSPRSDEEIALFNRYKKAFNQLKNSGIKYKIGVNEYDIAELFYYYNQIAFQGRIGEETLTKIFEDSLDYKTIADFISYENDFDNNRDIILDKDIDEFDFVKAVAPKANPRSTNLKYFYSIDPQTGLMAFWNKAEEESYDDADIGPLDRRTDVINGFEPHSLSVTEESAVNYFTTEAYDKKDLNGKEKMTISGKEIDVDISVNHDSGNINLIKLTATDDMANTILDELVSFKQIGDKLLIKITDSRGREVLKKEFVGLDARINKKIPIKFEFVEGNLTTVYDTKALADRINTLKNPC